MKRYASFAMNMILGLLVIAVASVSLSYAGQLLAVIGTWRGIRWLTVTRKLDKFIERFEWIIGYGATLIALAAAAYYTEPSRLQKIEAGWHEGQRNSTLCRAYVSVTPGKTSKDFPDVCQQQLPPPPKASG